jgi:hypothetical protein
MGKTKRNSDYKNFVDSDKNNLMIIKPKKIVEQVRTFDGEEDFVVQRNNTYLDKGLIVQTNNNPDSIVDVVGVSDSVYKNAGGSINLSGSVTTSTNGAYVQISGGQQPYQSVSYTFGSATGQTQGNPNSANFGINANFNQANNCYQGGQYNLVVNVTDANGDTGTFNWGGTIQGTCTTGSGTTPTPISGLSATATLVGGNNIQCNALWSNGTAPYSVKYTLLKIPLIGGSTTIQGTQVQTPTTTNDTFTAQNLPNGKYKFNVEVIDSNNNTLTTSTSTITINQVSGSGGGGTFISNVTSNPISSLTATATLVGGNSIQCDANWSNGTASYSVKYTLSKINPIGIPSVVGSPIIQSTSNTNDSFTAQNLADGKYKFEVVVTDSNNDTLTATSQTITILSSYNPNVIVGNPNPTLSGLNVNASLIINDDLQCDATWSNGTAPFVVKYSLFKDGNLVSTTPKNTSTNYDTFVIPTNSNAGTYYFKVEVTDANNDTKTENSQLITIQSNIVTPTSLSLSGLSLNATIVGSNNNDLKCDASWSNGTSPYSISYFLYKDGSLLATIPTQSSTTNNDTYTATNLADGNYQYKVFVSDNQGSISGISQLVNITNPSGTPPPPPPPPSGTPPTPPTPSASTNAPILGGGGFQTIEKPVYIERETIVEFESFYSKNKFPIWLLIAIGVYLIASNKDNK